MSVCFSKWGRFLLAGLSLASIAAAQDFNVQLLTPLTASANHKGDPVRAMVLQPTQFQGDTLQGQITETKSSKGQSFIQFNLVSLLHQGVLVPVAATVNSISNSKGEPGMDEQMRPFAASNPAPAESKAKQRIGSRLGGMLGGNAGGAISDASNTSGAPPIPTIRVVSQGPDVQIGQGASMGLSLHSTGRQDLESLPANTPPTTAASAASAPMSAASGPSVTAASPSAGADSGQPELKSARIDFVPGERTIFMDDFSDMEPDEPPPHWKLREGRVELRTGGGVRELYSGTTGESVNLTSPKIAVPQNFTFELLWTGTGETDWSFHTEDNSEAIRVVVRGEPDGHTANMSVSAGEELGHGTLNTDTSKPVLFALWAQQGRVRAYLNGERLVDVNQVEFKPITQLLASFGGYRPNGLRSIRIAESAPDFSTTINSSGKYVTHGIHFDTDSDRLKPESAAVLKQVAAGLDKNPNLKLEIDGYTDSVGNADHNLDLSKRRAEAVRSVLVSQFGVDAARLTANGFGADKPIGSNDTPDGRATNRRVEFIKQ